MSSSITITSTEHDHLLDQLGVDLDPFLGLLPPSDRRYDLSDVRRAIRRLQTTVDLIGELDVARLSARPDGDVTLPPSTVSDLRERLLAMVVEVDENAAREHALPADAAMWRARQRRFHALADRLGVEIPQEVQA